MGGTEAPAEVDCGGRGLRTLSAGTVRFVARTGGVLYAVTGFSLVQVAVAATDSISRPSAYVAEAVVTMAIGISVVVLSATLSDRLLARAYPALAYGLVFGATSLVSIGLVLAGTERWNAGACVYLIAPIYGFYVFARRVAVALVAVIGLQYAAVLAAADGVAAPASQWLFVMAVLVATAVLVARLVSRSDELAALQRAAHVAELRRLRRFLPPAVADAVLAAGGEQALQPHRRRIAVLFVDLRGFTRFSAAAEPEDVVELLRAYYDTVTSVLARHGATVGSFAGDGIMAYVGDPMPVHDPVAVAVDVTDRLRRPLDALLRRWRRQGFDLGYGIGIAYGHATLGLVGSAERCDYTALGSVVNLAARLCGEAAAGEVILDQRAHEALCDRRSDEPRALMLKGFDRPVPAYRLSLPAAIGGTFVALQAASG